MLPNDEHYVLLRSWRDVCELLNSSWYKFQEPRDLVQMLPERLAVWAIEYREHRKDLWDLAQLQFIRWGTHPAAEFKREHRELRRFKGWSLLLDWESKIDFLEKITLLQRSPEDLPKPWQANKIKRVIKKQSLQDILDRKVFDEETKRTARRIEIKRERFANGECWACRRPMVPLMIDCPGCGMWYEDFSGR